MLGTTWTSSRDPGKRPLVYRVCLWKTRARQQDHLLQSSRKSECAQGLTATVREQTESLPQNCCMASGQRTISWLGGGSHWFLEVVVKLGDDCGYFSFCLWNGKKCLQEIMQEKIGTDQRTSHKQDSRAHWQSKLKSALATSKGAQIIRQTLYGSV